MRPTETITLPQSKTVVEIYSYLTERENRQIKAVFLQSFEQVSSPNAENGFVNKILDKDFDNKASDLSIKLFVQKYGEITDKNEILEKLLDGDVVDFEFLKKALNEKREKKTS